MKHVLSELNRFRQMGIGYWSERIISQLEYAIQVSKVKKGEHHELIRKTVDFLADEADREGIITRSAAMKAESLLSEMSASAKSFQLICAAHAHIDMNWMWGYHETVALTLDTFRTMLNLMEEYPDFKFSQSQASVYKIVEEYEPAMLEEIKKKIHEGQWEVIASTWVETDKNMPNGESLARHILYTKKTLSKLLDIQPESLELDFEPDTFGHSRNVPEILTQGGVKYYYHCRGYNKRSIYQWKSPSGNSILAYCEPEWYNAFIEPSMALHIPQFCTDNGIQTMLKVYGVGDHGGGPTRRDIEKIIEMSSWPVFPDIRFGTFREYFKILERNRDQFPVEEDELNFAFTGCYTTQTRIKAGNRVSEAKLNEAECLSTISGLFAGGRYRSDLLEKAWENVLFNHFHDILPGSGVIDTREYAMGLFQKTIAAANNELFSAMRNIASRINTVGLNLPSEDFGKTMSEGAGTGFGIAEYGIPQTERGRGINRIFHIFNPSSHEREEPVEITVWDWPGDKGRILVRDCFGNPLQHQIIAGEAGKKDEKYWDHEYFTMLVEMKVPACGYMTAVLSEKEPEEIPVNLLRGVRVEQEDNYILENNCIRVKFDPQNAAILSLTDKKTGTEMMKDNHPGGIFRLVHEDDVRGMTAWIVGRAMKVENLNTAVNVKISKLHTGGNALRQWLKYSLAFGQSELKVTVSLNQHSSRLDYEVECDWQERAEKGKYVPQLNFYLPLGYESIGYRYDIPFGTIDRQGKEMDMPANSWIMGIPSEGRNLAVMLMTQTKYGFRGAADSLAVTLIRSAYTPDPYPEIGIHHIRFSIGLTDSTRKSLSIRQAFDYNHPVKFLSGTIHPGDHPPEKSYITLEEGSAVISAVKIPENSPNESMLIRVYETEGNNTDVKIRFARRVKSAVFMDINEKPLNNGQAIHPDKESITFRVNAYSVAGICVQFE